MNVKQILKLLFWNFVLDLVVARYCCKMVGNFKLNIYTQHEHRAHIHILCEAELYFYLFFSSIHMCVCSASHMTNKYGFSAMHISENLTINRMTKYLVTHLLNFAMTGKKNAISSHFTYEHMMLYAFRLVCGHSIVGEEFNWTFFYR